MLPCPVIMAKTGAPIAQAAINTITPRLIIAARSRRSLRHARIQGLLPSISFWAATALSDDGSTGSSDSPTAEMSYVMTFSLLAASSCAGDKAGLDHALLFGNGRLGQRDVLTVFHREVTCSNVIRGIAEPRNKFRLGGDAGLPGFRAARVEAAARRRMDR
jgi:hypothetical protein